MCFTFAVAVLGSCSIDFGFFAKQLHSRIMRAADTNYSLFSGQTSGNKYNTTVFFKLKNTIEVLCFNHELKTNEKMVGTTRGNFSAGQGFTLESVFKR